MPGQRAPRRREDSVLLGILRRNLGEDVDQEQLADEIDVADPERLRGGIDAHDLHTGEPPPQRGGR
jgi:hypothetical protein